MTGPGIAADALLLLAALAGLALLLFVLGTWLGRWPLWLAGYGIAILTLAIALFSRDPVRTGERGAGDARVQRSTVAGVVDSVEDRAGPFVPAWREEAVESYVRKESA